MSETYDAIYQVALSRIGHFNGQQLAEDIAAKFDISFHTEMVKQEFLNVAYEQMRPSIIYRPFISIDGNQWCALYGDNLQDGVAGFGDSPAKAMIDFDKQWVRELNTHEIN